MRIEVLGPDVLGFGGKADVLGRCLTARLPVPPGVVLDESAATAVAHGDRATTAALLSAVGALAGPFAVRSSAAAEDGAEASFAGQLETVLGVALPAVPTAIAEVLASGRTAAVAAYRGRRGIGGLGATNVLVQQLVPAVAAGVLFTRDPLGGVDGPVVEASWGFGTSVVEGLVVPDRITRSRYEPGDKDVERVLEDGRVVERPVPHDRRYQPCLALRSVAELFRLAEHCDRLLPSGHGLDLEWVLDADGVVWLLQARPVTAVLVQGERVGT